MWKQLHLKSLALSGSITGPVGVAAICAVLTHYFSNAQAEIPSELVCWLILPIFFRSAHAKEYDDDSRTSKAGLQRMVEQDAKHAPYPASLWLVAIGITTVPAYKAECKGLVAFFPLLPSLLLAVQKHARRSETAPSVLLRPTHPRTTSSSFDTIPVALFTGLFSTLTLSGWDLQASALSIIPVAAMLVVYIALEHDNDVIGRTRFLPRISFQRYIMPLASRILALLVACLVVDTVLFGFRKFSIATTVALGFVKALSWYFTARAAYNTSWRIAPAIVTFSTMTTPAPFSQLSEFRALLNVAASLLSLGSIIHMVPQVPRRRSTLWFLAFVSLGPYFTNTIAITSARLTAQTLAGQSHRHPVELLSCAEDINFRNMMKSQSKNYTAAHDEYRRRYGLEPPTGFDAWYEFAVVNQSPLIDDFDSILDALSPFLGVSGAEVAETIRDAYDAPDSDLWLCSFSGAQAETRCEHAHRTFDRHIASSFNKRLGGLGGGSIPSVQFLVNHIDEPRVLVPPQSTRGTKERHAFGNERFLLKSMSGRPVAREIMKYCDSQKDTVSKHGNGMVATGNNASVETYGLPFVASPKSAADLCQYPTQSALHGLIARPKSFRLIEGLVPVLSTGSLATMGDILFPSPAYIEDEFKYDERHDVEWSRKRNNVYWAGSTTGGLASDELWRDYHRQRFVTLGQNLQSSTKRKHIYLQQINGVIEQVTSSFLNSRLYDIAFTRIFQCERRQCRDQNLYFDVRSWVDKNEALRSRLVFDLDGNGISGRYYKLLASKSTPLKQTLLREWHDDRLVPWVHYVPVSLSMEELPELVTYLTTTEAGQRRAQEIAKQGREWYSKAFREVDLAIYIYRLLLELARLQDSDRQVI